jgi:iron-sulfur cluster assembly accessory protein
MLDTSVLNANSPAQTPKAIDRIRQLYSSSDQPKLLRIGVKTRGCSGLEYALDYVEQKGKLDESVTQDGVTVLVDSKALFSIIGSEMDFVEDKLSSQFVFTNPNVKETCGCGQSFMV